MGAVPGPAVGIGLGIGGRSQRQMRPSAFIRRRSAIDRRPQQRVAEGYLCAEIKQATRLRGACGLSLDAKNPGRSPQQR